MWIDSQYLGVDAHAVESVDLPKCVREIPAMLHYEDRKLIYITAKERYGFRGSWIDAGSFVGGSTATAAHGMLCNAALESLSSLSSRPIHAFDLFEAGHTEALLLTEFYGRSFKEGERFNNLFSQNVGVLQEMIQPHAGDIMQYTWQGADIEVAFVDICKTSNITNHVFREFFPSLIPEVSLVIHQDYIHAFTPWIPIKMALFRDLFVKVAEIGFCVVFTPTAAISRETVDARLVGGISFLDGMELIDSAIADARTMSCQRHLELAQTVFQFYHQGKEKALDRLNGLNSKYQGDKECSSAFQSVIDHMDYVADHPELIEKLLSDSASFKATVQR